MCGGSNDPPLGRDTARPSTFSQELSAAISGSGLSLAKVQERLARSGARISLATLSYWRSGQRRPEGAASLDVVVELEGVLGLDPGRLSDRLGPSRRLGRRREPVSYADVISVGPGNQLRQVLADLDLLEFNERLVERSAAVTIDLDATGEIVRHSARTVFKAVRDGNRTFPLVLTNHGHPVSRPPVVGGLRGCTRGRTVEDLEHGFCVYELVLTTPVDTGETVVVEHTTELSGWEGERSQCYEHYLVHRVPDLLLWVRFDQRLLPSMCQTYEQRPGEAERVRTLPPPVDGLVHLALTDPGPGTAGIRWEW